MVYKDMKKVPLNLLEDMALSQIKAMPQARWDPSPVEWIKVLRNHLRMTQAELAKRAGISQPHLAAIERGRFDPQVRTLKRIFEALSCDLMIVPRPRKDIEEVLRGRARSVALKRLKHSMGTMALENQAPSADVFRHLLEKRTDEILKDRRERLWEPK